MITSAIKQGDFPNDSFRLCDTSNGEALVQSLNKIIVGTANIAWMIEFICRGEIIDGDKKTTTDEEIAEDAWDRLCCCETLAVTLGAYRKALAEINGAIARDNYGH